MMVSHDPNTPEQEQEEKQEEKKEMLGIWSGIGIGFLIQLVCAFTGFFFLGPLATIGLTIYAFVTGKKRFGQGLLIILGISILLIAACFGLVIVLLRGMHG
jgi:hypothetical protein